jgi:hypothetical protein
VSCIRQPTATPQQPTATPQQPTAIPQQPTAIPQQQLVWFSHSGLSTSPPHIWLGTFIRGVSKKVGEWYQKTNKTEDTNKLTLLAFKIISILHNTLLATFIKLLETVSKGLFRNRLQNLTVTRHMVSIQERVTAVLWSIAKQAFANSFQKLYERCQQCVVKDGDYFEGQ